MGSGSSQGAPPHKTETHKKSSQSYSSLWSELHNPTAYTKACQPGPILLLSTYRVKHSASPDFHAAHMRGAMF